MKPSTRKVLGLLESGPQTTATFARAFCPRASARILELRSMGYEVTTTQLGQSSFRYELVGRPDDTPSVPQPSRAGVLDAEAPAAPPAAADSEREARDAPLALFDMAEIDLLPPRRWEDAA